MATKNKKKGGDGAMIAATAAGAAAVGAGAYYLFGPNGKANQKKAKDLAAKIKKEAMQEYKKAKSLTVPVYHKAVDMISENYAKQYKLHEEDIRGIAQKIKGEWKGISSKAESTAKKTVRKAKRAVSGIKAQTKKSAK